MKTFAFQEFIGGSVKETKFDFENGIYNKLYGRKFSGNVGELDGQFGMQIYDSAGNLIKWLYSDGTKITFDYDEKDRLKESIQWRNNKIEIRTRYSYKNDSQRNWIEQYEYKNYPNSSGIDPQKFYEGETKYREITYYE